jgi:hypothetical protein
MVIRDTGISVKLYGANLFVEPEHAVRYQLFDEFDQPLQKDYSMDSLLAMDDDRIAAIKFCIDSLKAVFDNVTKLRNEQLSKLAKEMETMTGAPIQAASIPEYQAFTGISGTIPPEQPQDD